MTNAYSVVKFTIMAVTPDTEYKGTWRRVPTEVEFRFEDNGQGIEPKSLLIAGDLFTIGSACNRLRTDK